MGKRARGWLSSKREAKTLQDHLEAVGPACIAPSHSGNGFGEGLAQTRWLGAEEAAHLHD
jgi:hypothetical protein